MLSRNKRRLQSFKIKHPFLPNSKIPNLDRLGGIEVGFKI